MSGPSAKALASLNEEQRSFINNLPKAELHAHLNGSIPLPILRQLAKERRHLKERDGDPDVSIDDMLEKGIAVFENEVEFNKITDFFGLFPAIYALTSTAEATSRVTSAVLKRFLDSEYGPQCTYIELRTTPRSNGGMTREIYLNAVLDAIEEYPKERAALIVSIDRRMAVADAMECVDLAAKLKDAGRRVVGVDLCGDTSVHR
jgi:adenosine deaminase